MGRFTTSRRGGSCFSIRLGTHGDVSMALISGLLSTHLVFEMMPVRIGLLLSYTPMDWIGLGGFTMADIMEYDQTFLFTKLTIYFAPYGASPFVVVTLVTCTGIQ